MATFRFKRKLYSLDKSSYLNKGEDKVTKPVDTIDEKSDIDDVSKVSNSSGVSKVKTEDILDRIKKEPNNMILPSQLEKSKLSNQKKNPLNSSRNIQNKNIGIRINKTTTVNNPSNEKVQQARIQMEAQKLNQEDGKPDPNLIPKAPEPLKPVGLFKR